MLVALLIVLSPAVQATPATAARVAVLMSARVEEYDEAVRGFRGAIPKEAVTVYDMDGDIERGRKQLDEIDSKLKPDLVFAVGIWALRAVVSRPPSAPVVYAMVLNPPSVISPDAKNITGASLNVPVERQIWLFKQLGAKRIGVVFNDAKTGYLVRRAQAVARDEGIELVTREVSSPKDPIGAIASFQDTDDALLLVPGARNERHRMTEPARLTWFRGFSSFRARVFWSVVPIVVSFLVFQGWMNVREHRRLVTEEFEKRGQALASNLGYASELGALSEDLQLLEAAMRGTLRNPDVSYVLIHSRDRRVLARGGQLKASEAPPGDARGDRPSTRQVDRAGQRFFEFVSPIVSERSQTPDVVLLGPRVRPRGAEEMEEVIGTATVGLSLAGVEAQVRGLANLWSGITVAFLVVSAAVLYGFSLRITNPVKQLTQQAQKIAAGELDQQIAVRSHDEIGALADAFNHMTRSLRVSMNDKERALSELGELNRTLEDRIRQRTVELEVRGQALERSLTELEDKSRQLAAASRHKSDFLANVSHELRTPMNAILGFNEMILDQVYGEISDELRRPLTDIQQSGQHLLRLINDVLDLSKIEAGRMDLNLGEYSAGDAVAVVRASLGSLAAAKSLEFTVIVPEGLPLADVDG